MLVGALQQMEEGGRVRMFLSHALFSFPPLDPCLAPGILRVSRVCVIRDTGRKWRNLERELAIIEAGLNTRERPLLSKEQQYSIHGKQ